MASKRWSRREIWDLLGAATSMSQADAAKKLGRGPCSISTKALTENLRWRSSCVSLTNIAKQVSCAAATVQAVCAQLDVPKYGRGNGTRYLIDVALADELITVLKTRVLRNRQQQAAGRLRHA